MLVLKETKIETESAPGVGSQEGKPEEGPREGSHIYLKQGIGKMLERKLLTDGQLEELQ